MVRDIGDVICNIDHGSGENKYHKGIVARGDVTIILNTTGLRPARLPRNRDPSCIFFFFFPHSYATDSLIKTSAFERGFAAVCGVTDGLRGRGNQRIPF